MNLNQSDSLLTQFLDIINRLDEFITIIDRLQQTEALCTDLLPEDRVKEMQRLLDYLTGKTVRTHKDNKKIASRVMEIAEKFGLVLLYTGKGSVKLSYIDEPVYVYVTSAKSSRFQIMAAWGKKYVINIPLWPALGVRILTDAEEGNRRRYARKRKKTQTLPPSATTSSVTERDTIMEQTGEPLRGLTEQILKLIKSD